MSDDVSKVQRDLSSKQALVEKLKAIRALWITAHNQTTDLEPVATEFFFAIGDLLEGQHPDGLNLRHIVKADFLKELRAE